MAFYLGLFTVGPFAFLWFVAPALIVPVLMQSVPLDRRSPARLLVITIAAFVASFAHLRTVQSHSGNSAADLSAAAGWLAGAVLVLLAGAGYLRESRVLSAI